MAKNIRFFLRRYPCLVECAVFIEAHKDILLCSCSESQGYLICDGFGGYNKLKDVIRCGCLAHMRRYWHEVLPGKSKKSSDKTPAKIGFDYCNQLFEPYMENYLLDGRCSISNNIAENIARPYAVGRKNLLFHDTVKGARASSIISKMSPKV